MIGSPSSRIGANSRSPVAWSPIDAPSIVSSGPVAKRLGTSGIGGGRRKRTTELASSGSSAAQSR